MCRVMRLQYAYVYDICHPLFPMMCVQCAEQSKKFFQNENSPRSIITAKQPCEVNCSIILCVRTVFCVLLIVWYESVTDNFTLNLLKYMMRRHEATILYQFWNVAIEFFDYCIAKSIIDELYGVHELGPFGMIQITGKLSIISIMNNNNMKNLDGTLSHAMRIMRCQPGSE